MKGGPMNWNIFCINSGSSSIKSTHIATFDVIVTPEFTKVTDPGRIAAQIITGIGFFGTGRRIHTGTDTTVDSSNLAVPNKRIQIDAASPVSTSESLAPISWRSNDAQR
jgi:hypothetical protein